MKGTAASAIALENVLKDIDQKQYVDYLMSGLQKAWGPEMCNEILHMNLSNSWFRPDVIECLRTTFPETLELVDLMVVEQKKLNKQRKYLETKPPTDTSPVEMPFEIYYAAKYSLELWQANYDFTHMSPYITKGKKNLFSEMIQKRQGLLNRINQLYKILYAWRSGTPILIAKLSY